MRRRTTYRYPLLLICTLTSSASSRLVVASGRHRDAPPDADHHHDDDVPFSETIPPYETTMELLGLSADIYAYRGLSSCDDIVNGTTNADRPLPSGATCHLYERDEQDTQVMVISRPPSLPVPSSSGVNKGYVAVVYAGTDDFRNILTDGNIIFKSFGPKFANGTHPLVPPSNPDIEVHAGFNNAVFRHGLFDRVLDAVRSVLRDHPHYELLTGGHSLGAADAILTAVALSQKFGPDRTVQCINFGCPRTGNRAWRDYVNGLTNVGVWRFVNSVDIVPRLPDARFVHVGHTVQMNKKGSRAYWFHFGDYDRGFAGVPPGWEVAPFIIIPYNGVDHMILRYFIYLRDIAGMNRSKFYPSSFRRVDDDDDGVPMDDDFPPGDDDTIGPPIEDAAGNVLSDNARASVARDALDWYALRGGDDEVYALA